ncbi:MAG: guanylate kinase [Bacteroidetes bacterium]|nr:guanylate kinase [Bacteroidota bacterium]
MNGKLIIFSAPSGAGKTTLVKNLLAMGNLNLEFSISACSRAKRANEINGKDYYFLSVEDFKRKIMNDEFIEWEEVYEDNFYGTLRSEIDRIWKNGKHVVFDVDVVGGLNIKKNYPKDALSIFVTPPSIEILRARLIGRSTESEEDLKKRINKAKSELTYADQFDVQVVNEDKEVACNDARNVILNFLKR